MGKSGKEYRFKSQKKSKKKSWLYESPKQGQNKEQGTDRKAA